jgi:hypothetical protein
MAFSVAFGVVDNIRRRCRQPPQATHGARTSNALVSPCAVASHLYYCYCAYLLHALDGGRERLHLGLQLLDTVDLRVLEHLPVVLVFERAVDGLEPRLRDDRAGDDAANDGDDEAASIACQPYNRGSRSSFSFMVAALLLATLRQIIGHPWKNMVNRIICDIGYLTTKSILLYWSAPSLCSILQSCFPVAVHRSLSPRDHSHLPECFCRETFMTRPFDRHSYC